MGRTTPRSSLRDQRPSPTPASRQLTSQPWCIVIADVSQRRRDASVPPSELAHYCHVDARSVLSMSAVAQGELVARMPARRVPALVDLRLRLQLGRILHDQATTLVFPKTQHEPGRAQSASRNAVALKTVTQPAARLRGDFQVMALARGRLPNSFHSAGQRSRSSPSSRAGVGGRRTASVHTQSVCAS